MYSRIQRNSCALFRLFPRLRYVLLLILIFTSSGIPAQQVEFEQSVGIDEPEFGSLKVRSFYLQEETPIRISGMALGDINEQYMYSYGWILDAATRTVVWQMDFENAASVEQLKIKDVQYDIVHFDEFTSLPAGPYELYFTADLPNTAGVKSSTQSLFHKIFASGSSDETTSLLLSEAGIMIEGGSALKTASTDENPFDRNIIFSLGPAEDNSIYKQYMSVRNETDVRIYAIGEFAGFGEDGNDYGWIKNIKSDSIVWIMTRNESEYAGGGTKNRKTDMLLRLHPGEYAAYYVSDGSHAVNSWNDSPPYDPRFWGLTVLNVEKGGHSASIELIDRPKAAEPVISFTGLGNNRVVSQGITLSRKSALRIRALGEANYSLKSMVDFAWIINADTRRNVWSMTVENSRRAGGHSKNRVYDGIVELEAGNYIVHYKTDDTHAYNSWNEAPPRDPDAWGISVYCDELAGQERQYAIFNPYNYMPKDVIAMHKAVRHNAHVKKKFTMSEAARIRVYALGEGDYNNMYDYGWIERADTEQIVWEMAYRETTGAGGSKRNRMYDGTILLDEGEYNLFYVSNGSHAYNDWEDEPPFDIELWGISLYKSEQ